MKVNVGEGLLVDIQLNHAGQPPGKLADASLHFTAGSLAGLCILGFAVWERREQPNELNVTVPSRQFMAGGVKRRFNMVRIDAAPPAEEAAQEVKRAYYAPLNRLQRAIMAAYQNVVSMPKEDAPAVEEDSIPF